MRLVNDKQEPIEVKSVDVFALISQMFLVSVGIATGVFSPMVMVLSHCRFNNPWSKVAGVGGAVLAILLLEVPLAQVVIGFVFGLFVADCLQREVKPFHLISQAMAVGLIAAIACLFWGSITQHVTFSEFWGRWVVELIERLKATQAFEATMNWEMIKDLVLYEGPFLYLSALMLSTWIALGAAAHFGWVKEEKSYYSSASLKKLRIPRWLGLCFLASFVATFVIRSHYQYLVGGVFRVLSGFMFIQGSICLSIMLSQRGVRHGLRTLIYCVAVLLGFYALVGMGIMSPWILRKKGGISPQILPNNLEEQT